MLSMTGCVIYGLTGKTFHWIRVLIERFVTVGADLVCNSLFCRVGERLNCLLKCINSMAFFTGKFIKDAKEDILNKPESCNRGVAHNGTTLNLNKTSGVVEMHCDRGRSYGGISK